MGTSADTLMIVLLDSNIYFSALISPLGSSARIVKAWKNGRFYLLTCQPQIDEIREASRNPKFRDLFQPHHIVKMLEQNQDRYTRKAHSSFMLKFSGEVTAT